MKYPSVALTTAMLVLASTAHAQDAKVTITLKVPAKVASFSNQKLEILLLQEDPAIEKGPFFADKHINMAFSHTTGKETKVEVVLGQKVKLNPRVQYLVKVYVLDPKTNKRLYIGEREVGSGECFVLTNGAANKATMIVRPLN